MKIHFIGIGGIGISALAKYYIEKGHEVTGSDLVESEITQALTHQGAKIHIGPHRAENIPFAADLVIYSPAVQKENPELQQAKSILNTGSIATRWIPKAMKKTQARILSYPEALGDLTKEHYTIAVSGTHGKSTTTAMLGLLLIHAGFDPTIIVGTKVKEFDPTPPSGTNCRIGKETFMFKGRPILLIEADEHFASFLNYSPDMIVLTSVEPDHLDYYQNLDNIIKTFKRYTNLLPKSGIIIANKDDSNIQKIIHSVKHTIYQYDSSWEAAKELRKILQVPGEYNVSNAHAALTAARALGVPDSISYEALSKFRGTWRRFEVFDLQSPVPYTLVSDYGHHPTEVRVTVNAARDKWPDSTLWLVFQPHQYQRTFYFYRDFVAILSRLPIDKLILADIYDVAGREETEIRKKVSSKLLARDITKKRGRKTTFDALYIPTVEEIEIYLQQNLKGKEVVMVMGAGDIYNLTLRLTQGKSSV